MNYLIILLLILPIYTLKNDCTKINYCTNEKICQQSNILQKDEIKKYFIILID